MKTLFVGIDVSTKNNQVCAMNFNQDIHFNLSFSNTPEGSCLLAQSILGFIDKFAYDSLTIVAESTSIYDFHICNYLLDAFSSINIKSLIYSVNAKAVSNYKKSYVELEKNDPGDAFVCADFARVGRCKNLKPFRASQLLALKRLTRQRFHLSHDLTREKNYVLNNIYLKISGLITLDKKDMPFSDTFGKTSVQLLIDFIDPNDIENLSLDDLILYLQTQSKNRCDDYFKIADKLQYAIRASYKLDKISYDPLTIAIISSINVIRCLENQIKWLDKAIAREIKGINPNGYNALLSIPGIGPVIAAGILAEIDDISFFDNQAALAKYVGLVWKSNDSGNFNSENKRSAIASNKYLKYYIVQATQLSVTHKFEYTTSYFYKKYTESKTHKHKRALVLTSRKLIRLIFVLLRDNKMYVPDNSGATNT